MNIVCTTSPIESSITNEMSISFITSFASTSIMIVFSFIVFAFDIDIKSNISGARKDFDASANTKKEKNYQLLGVSLLSLMITLFALCQVMFIKHNVSHWIMISLIAIQVLLTLMMIIGKFTSIGFLNSIFEYLSYATSQVFIYSIVLLASAITLCVLKFMGLIDIKCKCDKYYIMIMSILMAIFMITATLFLINNRKKDTWIKIVTHEDNTPSDSITTFLAILFTLLSAILVGMLLVIKSDTTAVTANI